MKEKQTPIRVRLNGRHCRRAHWVSVWVQKFTPKHHLLTFDTQLKRPVFQGTFSGPFSFSKRTGRGRFIGPPSVLYDSGPCSFVKGKPVPEGELYTEVELTRYTGWRVEMCAVVGRYTIKALMAKGD